MSFQAVAWAKKKSCNTPLTKLVLVWLCEYADEKNSCYPSEKHLADLCGVTDRSIRRSLTWLRDNGLISVQHRKGTSNRYFVSMDIDDQPPLEVKDQPLRTSTSSNNKDDNKDLNIMHADLTAFMECWKVYPRKLGKKKALMSFTRAVKNGNKEHEILEGLMIQIRMWKQEERQQQYIPHFSTWLNGESWNDCEELKKTLKEVDKKRTNINWLAG